MGDALALQLSVLGMYLPPCSKWHLPPQTIISRAGPHYALARADGAFTTVVAVQVLSVHSLASDIIGEACN